MSRAAPARRAAYGALRAVNSGRLDLPEALARARQRLPDIRDQHLAAEVVTGTLRWMGELDAVIEAFTRRPLPGLDAEVLDILRLSAYQLLHLDRVPDRAVVSDAVELVRDARKPSAGGMVNAVLRRVTRERDRLPLPPRPQPGDEAGAIDYLSVTLSHPKWLAERWLARAGFEGAERWERFNNEAAPLTLRVNTLLTASEDLARALAACGVRVSATRYAPDGLVVTAGNPFDTPLHQAGAFFVQDEASQLVAFVAAARPGERVLDACASPGGKAAAMAAAMRGEGLLVAGDNRRRRLDLLKETLARAAAQSIRIVRLDAEALPFREAFDLVLLDAPCSGLGTIRRDPEIRWRQSADALVELARAQRAMLDRAARAVKPDGRVVYATCSSEPEEGERLVAEFLDDHPEFQLEEALPSGLWPADLPPLVTPEGFFRTWPHVHGLEAFFAAVLRCRRYFVKPKHL